MGYKVAKRKQRNLHTNLKIKKHNKQVCLFFQIYISSKILLHIIHWTSYDVNLNYFAIVLVMANIALF